MVQVMVAGGIQQTRIAAVLGIREATMRKHFAHDIATAADIANAAVIANLYKIATGNTRDAVRAIDIWTSARLGWRRLRSQEDDLPDAPLGITFRWAQHEPVTVDAEPITETQAIDGAQAAETKSGQ